MENENLITQTTGVPILQEIMGCSICKEEIKPMMGRRFFLVVNANEKKLSSFVGESVCKAIS